MLGDDPCKVSLYSSSGTFISDLTRYIISGSFSRKANAISTFSGSFVLDQGSCVDLESIDFWSTYIVCERDDRDQWSGPVTNVVYNDGNIEVVASDKSAYWTRTYVATATYSLVDVAEIADDLISNSLATNLFALPEISRSTAGTVLSKSYVGSEYKSLSDAIDGLTGLNWTVFCETVFLSGTYDNASSIVKVDDTLWNPLPTVERSGQTYANQVIVVGKGVVGVAEAPADEISFYGLITRRYDEADLKTQASVNSSALNHLARCRDSTYLNTDGSSVLSPKLNISLAELIPGSFVEVDHSVGPYPVQRRMRIDEVGFDCVTGKTTLALEPLAIPDEGTLS